MPRKSYRVSFPGGNEIPGRNEIPGGNGHSLAGIVDRPDDQSSRPCVVFSHCFTCNKDLKAIVRIARALADAGIAVLRFDMTGLGGSEGEFSSTSFTTNVRDLQSAILFAQSEVGPVTALMGHSFGGAASLAVAATGMPSLRAVVTLAAPSDTVHLAELLSRMNPEIEQVGQGEVTIGGVRWLIRKEMLEDFRRYDLPSLIAKIDVPTLIFHSPVDKTVGFDHALRIMGIIQGSPTSSLAASLVALHGADHLLAERSDDLKYVASTTAAFIHRYAPSESASME